MIGCQTRREACEQEDVCSDCECVTCLRNDAIGNGECKGCDICEGAQHGCEYSLDSTEDDNGNPIEGYFGNSWYIPPEDD